MLKISPLFFGIHQIIDLVFAGKSLVYRDLEDSSELSFFLCKDLGAMFRKLFTAISTFRVYQHALIADFLLVQKTMNP